MLIDSHCHIDDARFDTDRSAMIQRARDAGIEHFVTIGCDLETSRAAVALAQKHPFISATVGVHPHEVKHIQNNWYDELRALAKSKGVVAYGEIGLDYHYDHSPREVQRARCAFRSSSTRARPRRTRSRFSKKRRPARWAGSFTASRATPGWPRTAWIWGFISHSPASSPSRTRRCCATSPRRSHWTASSWRPTARISR